MLLALSSTADGSSSAPGELRIMKWVILRETYLTKLHGVVTAHRKRAKSDRKRPSPKLFALLTELLSVLRRITVEIVEAVEKWRRRDKTKPFIWGSSNYLVKAAGDIEFLSRLPGLEEHLGVVVTGNPFLTHTGLDGRPTVLDRTSISLDYQNGGVVYRDDDYYYEQEDGEGADHDDEQNLNYYYEQQQGDCGQQEGGYEQQEGGYDAYTEVEPQAGYAPHDTTAEDERFVSRGNPDADPSAVDSDRAERRPSDRGGYCDNPPAPAAAPEGGAATENVASAPSTDGLGGPPLQPATSDPYHQQWSGDAGEPTAHQPTETLPTVAEEGRSSDHLNPQDGSHGRMGRRGSPFNLIFNMCDGMLTDLKGLGGRSNDREDDAYQFEPIMLGDLAGRRDRTDGLETPATVGTGDDREEGGAGFTPAQQVDVGQNSKTTKNVVGRGQAESPPPKLRGATYASLTRDIVQRSKEGSPKRKKGSSGGSGDEGSGAEDYSNRILNASFSAWAERTEGRLRHRDAKAAGHHRLHQLRHAMSAWEAHRAKVLGGRMADAFAGRFGLASRFFVRFTFDALRTHAKGARLAARNRTAMGKFVTHLERFGKARLRQAWRRWAPPKLGPEYWGAEHEEALKKLCRQWGRGRLRDALCTWRQTEPVSASARPLLHKAGSFAVLKAKLKAAGSFANPKASKQHQAPATSQGSRHQEEPTSAGRGNSEEEDSWAAWLGNEQSVSIVSPNGEKSSLRAEPEANGIAASYSSERVAEGQQALSPTRSFRGLGAALKSMKSFRDGRDKSQTQRPGLRSTASFGSPPHSPGSTPAPAPPSSLSPANTDAAVDVLDALQTQHFAAVRTKLRDEAAKLQSRELAAATIQRALWRAPRERRAAARVSNSATLIQRMVRLRSRRVRAGARLVRAWRSRVRARVTTLDRALVEAAGAGDLRAVAFLLRPAAALGMKQGVGVGICTGLGGANAHATAGAEGRTALHEAASAGGSVGERHYAPATAATESSRDKDADRNGGVSAAAPVTFTVKSNSGLLHNSERWGGGGGGSWLRGRESSPNWVGVIETLVQAGAMIEARDRRGFTPMMTAAAEGSRETVTILATLGAELNTKEVQGGRRTPLVLAAQKANAPAAAALLEYGAKANLTVGDNLAPLHEAVGAGSIAVAEMLVRAGANVNAKSESGGMTPLHLAVANGQHAAARLLVHSGANVCLPDSRGLTCLRLTVEMADAPTVALLLAAEPPADLSVEDENGGTVLHAACRLGLTDIAQLLLEHGADPHARDARGRTPELVALDLGHVDCAGLFYNMDIHSYTPKRTNSGESSDNDDGMSGATGGQGRDGGHGMGRSEEGDDEVNIDGETGAGGAARASTTSVGQDFREAVAAARRASSLSVLQQQFEGEEEWADPRRSPRRAASSCALGDGVAQGDGEAEEGRREGQQQRQGYGYGYEGGFAEKGEDEQQFMEGSAGEGNANAEGERVDWEWSETEGWVRAGDNGSNVPAGTQAPEDERQHEDTRAAADSFAHGEDGYSGEGYTEPRMSGSYSDWQEPYYPTSQGDSHGGSYDGTYQEDQQQQQQFSSGQVGGDESYDAADGVANDDDNVPQQDQRNTNSSERGSWEGPGRRDSAELLQEMGVAATERDGNNRDLFEVALGEGWVPADSEKETAAVDELGQNVGAAANYDRSNGKERPDNDDREQENAAEAYSNGNSEDVSGKDANISSGWGRATAVATTSNRWMSLLDTSSGNVYYQNERSGQTEWDLPEGAIVVSEAPEDV
eukprot:g15584.t1